MVLTTTAVRWLCVFTCLSQSQRCFSRVCSVIFFCMYSLPWRQVPYMCFNERQQAHTCMSHLLTSSWKLWFWPCLIVCVCLRVRVHVRVSGICWLFVRCPSIWNGDNLFALWMSVQGELNLLIVWFLQKQRVDVIAFYHSKYALVNLFACSVAVWCRILT